MKKTYVGYVRKSFRNENRNKSPVYYSQRHLIGKFRRLAQNKFNLKTRNKICFNCTNFSFFFIIRLPSQFWKLGKIAREKDIEIKGDNKMAKSSENYLSVKLWCLNILDSYRVLNAGFDELSATITSITTLDENGLEDELFHKKSLPLRRILNSWIVLWAKEFGRKDSFSASEQCTPDDE